MIHRIAHPQTSRKQTFRSWVQSCSKPSWLSYRCPTTKTLPTPTTNKQPAEEVNNLTIYTSIIPVTDRTIFPIELHARRPNTITKHSHPVNSQGVASVATLHAIMCRFQTDIIKCSNCFPCWYTLNGRAWLLGGSKVWWRVRTKFGSSCVRRSERAVIPIYHRPLEKPLPEPATY